MTIAHQLIAEVGTTMIPPGQFPEDWDAHWEPPADVAYGFDLEKAKQLLDEGGYTDSDGDGIREYKGKPIKLRLWARSESMSSQSMGKFITGWFEDIGLDIEFQVFDDAAISDKLYAYDKSGAYAPDYDMYTWYWLGGSDPTFILDLFTPEQIGGGPADRRFGARRAGGVARAAGRPIRCGVEWRGSFEGGGGCVCVAKTGE